MRYKVANIDSIENVYITETNDVNEVINKFKELDKSCKSNKHPYYIVDSKSTPIPFNTYDITNYKMLKGE